MNEKELDKILNGLLSTGSKISYLKSLKNKSIELIKKDLSLREVFFLIENVIQNKTESFLCDKNEYDVNYISGISTGIYLYDNGSYKFKVLGGTTKREGSEYIDENTLFDIASITKLFTLILLFKLKDLDLINLNSKISDINPDITGLEDYTINDLIRLHGILRTDGNIVDASSYDEAYEIFKTVYLEDSSKEKNTYTDFGAMVIGDTICKIISNEYDRQLNLAEIMDMFIFDPLGIKNTTYTPSKINISGNNNNLGLPHDPKAKRLGSKTGHAGLFTNSEDLMILAEGLFNKYLSDEYTRKLGEITFDYSPKGNLGVYVKHPLGWKYTYTPPEFSTGSFSHQGWTGPISAFDINNKIHNSILVNSIYDTDNECEVINNKPIGYKSRFNFYQSEITKSIMLMYILKKYYNNYIGVKEDINSVKLVR